MFAAVKWHRGSVLADDMPALEAALDAIEREIDPSRPQAISVERRNGDTLTILLGAPISFVSYIAHSGDPPYFSSLGDPTAKGIVTFYVERDHHSEAEAWCGIAPSEARQAVREFVAMDVGLPKCITWCML